MHPTSWVKEAGSPKRRAGPQYTAAGRAAAAGARRKRGSKVHAVVDGHDADGEDDEDAFTDASDASSGPPDSARGGGPGGGPGGPGARKLTAAQLQEEANQREERSRQLATAAMGIGACACAQLPVPLCWCLLFTPLRPATHARITQNFALSWLFALYPRVLQ